MDTLGDVVVLAISMFASFWIGWESHKESERRRMSLLTLGEDETIDLVTREHETH